MNGGKGSHHSEKQIKIGYSIFQYITFGTLSVLLGLLFYYIFKNGSTYSMDAGSKIVISLALLVLVFVVTQSFKLNVLDFLISSEINILCMYLLLSYIGFTYAIFSDPFMSLFNFIKDISYTLSDPTYIYENGFSMLIPIILFIIPIFVLLYDSTKSVVNALIIFAISIVIVYFLYPQNNVIPISGGDSPSSSIFNIVKSTTSSFLETIRSWF